ncbi:hypothetical protein J6590_012979 [Homalodisca vitripennis]|nr:hypothetical protein J6590_012979 [Homalodisca vitripennis]
MYHEQKARSFETSGNFVELSDRIQFCVLDSLSRETSSGYYQYVLEMKRQSIEWRLPSYR